MILALKLMLTNLVGMMMTKTMIIWGLKFATKQTDNKIDDNAVTLLEGLYDNDPIKVREAISAITKEFKED